MQRNIEVSHWRRYLVPLFSPFGVFFASVGLGTVEILYGLNPEKSAKQEFEKSWHQLIKGPKKTELFKEVAKISPHLYQLIQEVKEDMIFLNDDHKSRVEFKSIFSVLPKNFGSIFSLRDKPPPFESIRAISLLPDHFNVTSIKDLKAARLNQLLQNDYEWSVPTNEMWLTEAGKLLVDSFLLSDQAKKFLIARELNSCCNNWDLIKEASITAGSFFSFFILTAKLWNFLTASGVVPMTWPFLATFIVMPFFLCYLVSILFSKYINLNRRTINGESRALTRGLHDASGLKSMPENKNFISNDYHDGAIEYYSKEIQRNRALRSLMKTDHEANEWNYFKRKYSKFTEDGNYKSSVPILSLQRIKGWKES